MRNRTQSSTTFHSTRHLKTVRIALPPSPPPDLEMESIVAPNQPRRSQRINVAISERVVLPTDTVEQEERLRSGSKWRQHDLALLKVKFDPNEDSILSVLDVEHQWNASQRQSTSRL